MEMEKWDYIGKKKIRPDYAGKSLKALSRRVT
jgi:hypothetical protein